MQSPYFLGCPVWSCREWAGTLFRKDDRPGDFLSSYSSVFNTVEGNSVFYGLPRKETVARWAEQSRQGFRFAFKFPRVITHELGLTRSHRETAHFLNLMEPLAERGRLGPLFLQMPPLFGPRYFDELLRFLDALPGGFDFALEVRHRGWFDGENPGAEMERRLDAALRERGIDRVHLDSRPLFSGDPEDETEAESRRRKPRLPFRRTVTGRHPMVRLVGRNRVECVTPWLNTWAAIFAEWLEAGLEPFIFVHTPRDRHAPELARLFHRALGERLAGLPPLPEFPGEAEARILPRQISLFPNS